MKPDPTASREYAEFVAELKARIRHARVQATRAVNLALIPLYWDLGRRISEQQAVLGWGKSVVESLATDLQREFPGTRGFSPDNLWRMRQFFAAYSRAGVLEQVAPEWVTGARHRARKTGPPILEHPAPELRASRNESRSSVAEPGTPLGLLSEVPWGHHLEILKKVEPLKARIYYLRATARFGWTRNVLLNQIKAGAYERSLREGKAHNFPAALPEHLAEQAEEALKSSYNLEFLGIGRAVKERELEDRLIERLRDFILELGYGFCFVGRQHRLTLGRKEYFIDLLFYHRLLKALVAVDLKVGPFEPEFAGKMDFYLNLLNEKERAPDDHPSIGIILCAEKDNLEVEFALKTKANPIGVAEYQLQPRLPAELRGKLPTAKQLTDAVRSVLPASRKP
jgi:predicted nuclease of restriction endonuclease-like (RecB) superfamily